MLDVEVIQNEFDPAVGSRLDRELIKLEDARADRDRLFPAFDGMSRRLRKTKDLSLSMDADPADVARARSELPVVRERYRRSLAAYDLERGRAGQIEGDLAVFLPALRRRLARIKQVEVDLVKREAASARLHFVSLSENLIGQELTRLQTFIDDWIAVKE